MLLPGGFVLASSVMSRLDVDPYCHWCLSGQPSWLHVATGRLICRTCMRDAPAADGGEVGRKAERRLRAELDRERASRV
jgi:hypothetical protein